jgi:uncharacterized membrane protein
MVGWALTLTVGAAVGAGVVAGVLFTFSAFVMPALRRLRPADGLGAMQAINVTAVTPAFMAALFGTATASLALGVVAVLRWGMSFAVPLAVGSIAYLGGVVAVTAGFHVPRNNALATIDPSSPDAADRWSAYHRMRTRGNHVRTAAGVVAAAAFVWAIHVA